MRPVKNAAALSMLKLALAALERDVPNIDLARGVLRDAIAERLAHGDVRSKERLVFDHAEREAIASEGCSLSFATHLVRVGRALGDES